MDFRLHPRQGVAPCTPIRQRPDGYGFASLVGPWGAINPAFTNNPEPRQKAASRDCCGQISGRKLGTEPEKISEEGILFPCQSALVSMTLRKGRGKRRNRKYMVASEVHDALLCSAIHSPSSSSKDLENSKPHPWALSFISSPIPTQPSPLFQVWHNSQNLISRVLEWPKCCHQKPPIGFPSFLWVNRCFPS